MLLSQQDIEAELSYAFLHAICSRAGLGCAWTHRHTDNIAVDATIRAYEQFATDSMRFDFSVDIQLKATTKELQENEGRLSYSLPVGQYDKLRRKEVGNAKFLVLVRLPKDPAMWLEVSDDKLIANCRAYWQSLFGGEPTANTDSKTIYVPTSQRLDVERLRALMARISQQEVIPYAE